MLCSGVDRIRVIEATGRDAFALETLERFIAHVQVRVQNLQRHLLLQAEVFPQVDRAHAAGTKLRDDAVLTTQSLPKQTVSLFSFWTHASSAARAELHIIF